MRMIGCRIRKNLTLLNAAVGSTRLTRGFNDAQQVAWLSRATAALGGCASTELIAVERWPFSRKYGGYVFPSTITAKGLPSTTLWWQPPGRRAASARARWHHEWQPD